MSFLSRIFRAEPHNPARELALLGVEKRRQTVLERARQMRDELGLPPHPGLAR
jgi:RecA-family ATPase